MRIVITTTLLALAAALTTASPTPSPHEGHHGYPGPAFNSSVVHSNVTRPSGAQGTSPSEHTHSHGHGGTPLLVLNETQVLQGHAPDPLSYIAWDLYGERQGFKSGHGDDAFDIVVYTGKSHGWLMIWHILFMTGAFFIALPASIVLRSSKHPFQPIAHGVFVTLSLLGWATAASYKKAVPDLYQGSSHSPLSILLVLATIGISALEYVPKLIIFSRRFFAHVQRIAERGGSVSKTDLSEAWKIGRGDKGQIAIGEYERVGLVEEHDAEAEEEHDQPKEVLFEAAGWSNEPEQQQLPSPSGSGSSSPRRHHAHPPHPIHHPHQPVRGHSRKLSYQSDYSDASTLHNPSPTGTSPIGGSLEHIREEDGDVDAELQRELEQRREEEGGRPAPRGFFAKVWRFLWTSTTTMHFVWERLVVVLAYSMWVSGSVVYTGICREYYSNGCLAHLIKGSIFFLYGLLTFARYLGAYSDQGWAWNRLPAISSRLGATNDKRKKNPPSAELIESSVIFVYGATNTWMERFGAAPGSPYTAKQIQHISIAVMYFFGGAIGIALELGWLSLGPAKNKEAKRRWHHEERGEEMMDVQPYRSSYNPFAALCIGVTGIAMAAHHQTYLFQVQIHVLWGTLLAAYTVARCLTYFFLWLNPPRSTTPSRPPTEALASFLLTAGGLAFISSTEQIGFWAMRTGRDDMMMFANVIVALTFFCFTWMFGCLALKSWAVANAKRNGISVDDEGEERPHRSSFAYRHREEYELGPYGGKLRMKRHGAHA
ncbi:hypothetical protein M407DRAFT_21205 [Tulasnella calospora MUT 4182]|uniref:Cytoplasmic protein n=1 Tax=Tulasnella calospora MUT 4182 TaxID=1051891 RepID=A0A0C3M7F1_9AGAM|nr:hypothetical protein M407DRAFT_21205 [Tulasnella calospora MUT 4182]